MTLSSPSLGFVLVFLFFSVIFFFDTYKLLFRTVSYYEDIRNSLTRQPNIYPFREFWQKIFSAIGLVAVIGADVLVVMAYWTK
jgi:hypothetical protein